MKLKTILLITVATGSFSYEPAAAMRVEPPVISETGWFLKKKKKNDPQDSVKVENEYEKLTGGDNVARRGMFNVFQKKNDYYSEIPATLLGRDMLIVDKLRRVPSELNEAGVNHGTSYENQIIRLELDKPASRLSTRQSRPLPLSLSEGAISQPVRSNYISPLIAGFKIEVCNNDSTNMSIKVNDIYDGTEISANNVFTNINPGTSVIKSLSRTLSIKSFDNNIVAASELTTRATGGTTTTYATVEVSSSILLFPKVPVTGRLNSSCVGYFTNSLTNFSDGQQWVDRKQFITH